MLWPLLCVAAKASNGEHDNAMIAALTEAIFFNVDSS